MRRCLSSLRKRTAMSDSLAISLAMVCYLHHHVKPAQARRQDNRIWRTSEARHHRPSRDADVAGRNVIAHAGLAIPASWCRRIGVLGRMKWRIAVILTTVESAGGVAIGVLSTEVVGLTTPGS